MFFLFVSLTSRSMSFLRFFWSDLSSSVLLSLEDLLRLLGLFLLGCSFRGSLAFGETFLLLCSRSSFDHIKEGLFSRSLEQFSLSDIMLDLYFQTEEAFIYWLNFTVILKIEKVIFDFKIHIEFRGSTSDSDKDWKRTGDYAPVWHRLGSKNGVFDYMRFYNFNSYRFSYKLAFIPFLFFRMKQKQKSTF